MKRHITGAALAAFFLSGLLIGCGGDEPDAALTVATSVAQAPAEDPTRPPPVVSANATAAGDTTTGSAGDTGDTAGEVAPPPLPTAQPTAERTEPPPTPTLAPTVPPTAVPPTPVPPTAAPVVVQPTAVPPTAVPPTAAPAAPSGVRGLSGAHFAIQEHASLTVNGDIWFEFHVANSTSGDVPFDALGVMPKKDGTDRPQWYQHSWGGNSDVISAGGLEWNDHINLPEAGNYTLRLVICFDGPACQAQTGTWHTLSQEIPITVR